MKRVKIVLIRQPGWLPSLIRWLTHSDFNHCGLEDEDGGLYHLDWEGELTSHRDQHPEWDFLRVPMDWFEVNPGSSANHRYQYSVLANFGWVLQKLGLKVRPHTAERKTNCMGYIADKLGIEEVRWMAPGDLELSRRVASQLKS